jgi:hypothetical protein
MTPCEFELFGAKVFPSAVPAPPGVTPRSEHRVPCYRLAEVGPAGHRRLGILSDVSAGGAFVFLDLGEDRPALGSELDLVVLAPDSEPATYPAHVAHLEALGVGLKFDRPALDLSSKVLAGDR